MALGRERLYSSRRNSFLQGAALRSLGDRSFSSDINAWLYWGFSPEEMVLAFLRGLFGRVISGGHGFSHALSDAKSTQL
jgi:hypothetical protein